LEASDCINHILKGIDGTISTYQENKQLIKEKEEELQDIKHIIEFGCLDAIARLRIYKEYKKALNKRRELKLQNERLLTLYNYLSNKEGFRHKITQISGELKKKTQAQNNRGYKARQREDLVQKYLYGGR